MKLEFRVFSFFCCFELNKQKCWQSNNHEQVIALSLNSEHIYIDLKQFAVSGFLLNGNSRVKNVYFA